MHVNKGVVRHLQIKAYFSKSREHQEQFALPPDHTLPDTASLMSLFSIGTSMNDRSVCIGSGCCGTTIRVT